MPLTRPMRWLAIAAVLSCSGSVSAAETRGQKRTSVALLAGYGMAIKTVSAGGLDDFRLGFGCRVSVRLPSRLHLGGSFVEHVGSFRFAEDGNGTAVYRASYHASYATAEAGYDFDLRRIVLRPYIGAGLAIAFGRTDLARARVRDDHFSPLLAPGVQAVYRLPGSWLVGFDARVVGTCKALDDLGSLAPALFGTFGLEL